MSNYFVLFVRNMQGSPGFAANQRGWYLTLNQNNAQNYFKLCQKNILINTTCVLSIYFVQTTAFLSIVILIVGNDIFIYCKTMHLSTVLPAFLIGSYVYLHLFVLIS